MIKKCFCSGIITLMYIAGFSQLTETAPYTKDDIVYLLTYDHGGLILWGSEHFQERLRDAVSWLDEYPTFKIDLDNEAQIYDYFAVNEPALLEEIKEYLNKYKGRY